MKITIKTLNGYANAIEVELEDTDETIKNKILALSPRPFGDELKSIDQMRLILPTNKVFENATTVESNGLIEGSIVTLVVKMAQKQAEPTKPEELEKMATTTATTSATPKKPKKSCVIQ